MKITAFSDGHGMFPKFKEDGDILLIAGDILPVWNHNLTFQKHWYEESFIPWLDSLPFKHKVFCCGNHDLYFYHSSLKEIRKNLPSNCYYLQDDSVTLDGIKIYGTPWQLPFCDWAFNLCEEDLAIKFKKIPNDIDILLSHGPAYGYADIVLHKTYYCSDGNLGSKALLDAVRRTNPKFVISGHIHTANHELISGCFNNKITEFANVSYIDEKYEPYYDPLVFNI